MNNLTLNTSLCLLIHTSHMNITLQYDRLNISTKKELTIFVKWGIELEAREIGCTYIYNQWGDTSVPLPLTNTHSMFIHQSDCITGMFEDRH